MPLPSQGTSGPSGHLGLQSAPAQLFGGNYVASQPVLMQPSPEQSMANQIRKLTYNVDTILTLHEDSSSATKEKLDEVLKGLDRLGLGADDGNVAHKLQSTRNDAVLISLGRIKEKLKDVSDRFENVGRMGNSEDAKLVPELMGEIRNAVTDCQSIILAANAPGESPPPAPRACFGRGELIEEIVGLAGNLEPTALIGAGGIGKTSIALTVLHDDRIKQRFGENRRFIRCDQFPATLPHFLNRLSKVIGADIENPEGLTPLLPFLSSKESLIVLDNAESILDPQGTDAQEIYASVEELCQLDTVCLCITSRISTIPSDCETLEIPTLSMEAAREAFYRIYKKRGRSDSVDDILKQLEFHALSVTLLATVAQQNKWGIERLVKEWKGRRTDTLQTEHRTSLAATIELSLASPMFKELGADARGLLGVVAFYPQGVDKDNIDWLFPNVFDRTRILDKFAVLSLTYQSNGFITMLAPLRDYLRPKDPTSSPLLCTTKERYFARLSLSVAPGQPGHEDTRWISSEDVNVEHLLDVFTSANPDSTEVWDACNNFMIRFILHKSRQTVLRKKIEGLPDDHPSKPGCLSHLAKVSVALGNSSEGALLFNYALKLWRERGDEYSVAWALMELSSANGASLHPQESIRQAREALEIYERLGATEERASCLCTLAKVLRGVGQLDAAEDAVVESIRLLSPGEDQESSIFLCLRVLGDIYCDKGQTEEALRQYEEALRIATALGSSICLSIAHYVLAEFFTFMTAGDKLDEAQVHIVQTKSYLSVFDHPSFLGRATLLHAWIHCRQCRIEDAMSEALHAREILEGHGTSLEDIDSCNVLLEALEVVRGLQGTSQRPEERA